MRPSRSIGAASSCSPAWQASTVHGAARLQPAAAADRVLVAALAVLDEQRAQGREDRHVAARVRRFTFAARIPEADVHAAAARDGAQVPHARGGRIRGRQGATVSTTVAL